MVVKLEELYHLILELLTSDLSQGHRAAWKKKTAVLYLTDYSSEWCKIRDDYLSLSTKCTETCFYHVSYKTRAVTPFLWLRQKTLTLGFFRTLRELWLSNLAEIYLGWTSTILPNIIDLGRFSRSQASVKQKNWMHRYLKDYSTEWHQI